MRQCEMEGRSVTNDDLGMPELPASEHMVLALLDAGPVVYDGAGAAPLCWRDVQAYGECSGTLSEPWEFRTLRQMSAAYLVELQAATNPARIAPTNPEEELGGDDDD